MKIFRGNKIKVLSQVSKIIILIFSSQFLLAGCSLSVKNNDDYRYQEALGFFSPIDIEPLLEYQNYQQKISKLIVLVDESVSMKRNYKGISKEKYLLVIKSRMFETFPNKRPLESIFLPFGGHGQKTLHEVLLDTENYLNRSSDKATILILSDWGKINKESREAVEKLSDKYGNGLCINIIGIGNNHANKGLTTWENCGVAVSADSIANPIRMADFVRKVFFSEPVDSDNDGIYDYMDNCPETPKDVVINWSGCQRNSANSHPYYKIESSLKMPVKNIIVQGG
jgi:hypothetical protein